jgi:hypothetical protein
MTDYGNACSGFSDDEIADLQGIAASYRDAGGVIVRLSGLLGDRLADIVKTVPEGWQKTLDEASEFALRTSYAVAAGTQGGEAPAGFRDRTLAWFSGERAHIVAASISGALGGAGGLVTTAADLAATTTLILRSVQQIAAGYGEDITSEEVRLQCLGVFGFGGPLTEDDDVESGLVGVRLAIGGKTLEAVLGTVLPRFGILVSEKAMAQAAPILGALAGAAINPIFTDYYQKMAHVHFRLRRLEQRHEPDRVKACFERIVRVQREQRRGRGMS